MSFVFGPDAFAGTVCLTCGAEGEGDECRRCYDTRTNDRAGYLGGRHYTSYVDRVKQLKRDRRLDEAIRLLWQLFRRAEAEATKSRGGQAGHIAPWYTEQLAICYRKTRRPDLELDALDAYDHSPANWLGPQFDDRRPAAEAMLAKLRAAGEIPPAPSVT